MVTGHDGLARHLHISMQPWPNNCARSNRPVRVGENYMVPLDYKSGCHNRNRITVNITNYANTNQKCAYRAPCIPVIQVVTTNSWVV